MKHSEWRVEELSAEGISLGTWEEFSKNLCWRAIVGEIKARDQVLMDALRYGEPAWTDACIRARINELEFVLTIPQAVVTDLRLSQKNENKTNNQEGE